MPSPLIASPCYRDTRKAIDFLVDAFGFQVHTLYEAEDGTIVHEELTFGDAMVMLPRPDEGETGRLLSAVTDAGKPTGGFYLVIDDVDAHAERARAAGARSSSNPVTALTADATTPAATTKVTSGPSAPTIPGPTTGA